MRYLPYILKHLRRNWVRTSSTVLAMSVCIFLFCTLQTFVRAVTWNLKSASATRLVTRHAVSLVFNMPIAYKERIAALPGVRRVAIVNWFGGLRPNGFKDFFPNLAVEAEPYLAMHPEFIVEPGEQRAFFADLRGCLVGRRTATRFGWKVGDAFQLESFIPPYRVGRPFEFVIEGIFDTDPRRFPGTDTSVMLFHYKYLYESTGQRVGVGTFVIEIADPGQAGVISKAVDALFENSDAQTKTETEAAFRAGFVSMAGNLAFLLNTIALAVTFTILLVTANTMSMAVRERRTEIAVLKTLGFPSRLVMALILGESAALGGLGGGLGLLLGWVMIRLLPGLPYIGDAVRGFPDLGLSPAIAALGFGLALMLGLSAGMVPALLAYRARITDMLRQA
ncbi:MAG TPA: ABC transporter permease [Candidatus Polarisedimenticolia bacterium]|nr:ABC transporter permease [Candidatus Polarisedimenticolia bacterium]